MWSCYAYLRSAGSNAPSLSKGYIEQRSGEIVKLSSRCEGKAPSFGHPREPKDPSTVTLKIRLNGTKAVVQTK